MSTNNSFYYINKTVTSPTSTTISNSPSSEEIEKPAKLPATKSKKSTPPEKKRAKTGCLTCRKRHRKCDEAKPICKYCRVKGYQCVWPDNVIERKLINGSIQLSLPLSSNSNSNSNTNSNSNSNNNSTSSLLLSSFGDSSKTIDPSQIVPFQPPLLRMDRVPVNYSFLQLPFSIQEYPYSFNIIPNFSTNLNDPNQQPIMINYGLNCTVQYTTETHLLITFFKEEVAKLIKLDVEILENFNSLSVWFSMLALSSRVLEQWDRFYTPLNTVNYYLNALSELENERRQQQQQQTNLNLASLLLSWFDILSTSPVEWFQRISKYQMLLTTQPELKLQSSWLSTIIISNDFNFSGFLTTGNILKINSIDSLLFKSEILIEFLTPIEWMNIWNTFKNSKLGLKISCQRNGELILANSNELGEILTYHLGCYQLLWNKPSMIQFSYLDIKNPSEFEAIINPTSQFVPINIESLRFWHMDKIINILSYNMTWKSSKVLPNLFLAFHCIMKIKDNPALDKSKLFYITQRMSECSRLECFNWLRDEICI